ncbi:serpin family protein [uncultured Pseudoflavonifractor sp.]|uniref:serpin family protein n=1 Tax=uncultured Pseudoflavonifractor sp. TaxID=1221379 RepID=UPI0025FA6BC6|nr:serpin family protein [uncultured Pseudoflavonifractor sp.]
MLDRYKAANDALRPSAELVDRAAAGTGRKKRRRPLIPAAVAAVLAAVLLFTGVPGLTAPTVGGSAQALAVPEYPELPKAPGEPLLDTEQAWIDWNDAYDAYQDEWDAFRDAAPALEDQPGLPEALADFSANSAALALAGEYNRIYSPISLWFALAMLAETTAGETRQQVLTALGAEDLEQLRGWADSLWHALYTDDGTASLLLGSSIWLGEGMDFRQDVLDTLAERYYAASYRVPMGTDEADSALAAWVAEQTRGLIGGNGKVLETTPDTLAVLASTLYYQAGWRNEFLPANTSKDIFTTAGGESLTVDFMHRTDRNVSFLRREGYEAAAISTYLGQMVFVLPEEGVTPNDLLSDPDFLSGLDMDSGDAIQGEVRWSVPKFDVSSDLDLKPTLEGLGIADALDRDAADFSPLTDTEPVWVDQVKQIARVTVDEQGVEAAAVTLMAAAGSSAPPEDPAICVMDLDRPFLFLIKAEGTVLFVGAVENPG